MNSFLWRVVSGIRFGHGAVIKRNFVLAMLPACIAAHGHLQTLTSLPSALRWPADSRSTTDPPSTGDPLSTADSSGYTATQLHSSDTIAYFHSPCR